MRSGPRGRARSTVAARTATSVQREQAGTGNTADRREGPAAPLSQPAAWPAWARVLVSLVLLFHMSAVLAGSVGVPPSSVLERRLADCFTFYYDLLDLGYAYRFYAEPPPTPVVMATLRFGEGRPDEVVRLPGRSVAGPRMRHQRQLALANALFMEVQQDREQLGDGSHNRLARAYARHLCRSRPDCLGVTVHLLQHLIPDPEVVRKAMSVPGTARFDLFDESLFTTPQRIGDYPCEGF